MTDHYKGYTLEQRKAILLSALKTMHIKGDFEDCPACKFIIEETAYAKDIHYCSRCGHLFTGEKCKCFDEAYLHYYRHVVEETGEPGICPYCSSQNVVYDRGKDNYVKFILDDADEMHCIMFCGNCGRKSYEYYSFEFNRTEGCE